MHKANQELRILQKMIGNNIHNIRLEKKLTLKKCSKLTGISTDLLDQYELGKNHMHLRELIKIAYALNINVSSLLHVDM